MEVFFIRHGQTNGNLARRHQHPNTSLNEEGKDQVRKIIPEVIALAPTHFVSSTQLRAMETTRILASACDLIPATSSAFEELSRPLNLVGQRYVGLTTVFYLFHWFFKDQINEGESYHGFLERIIRARKYLESLPSDARVIVVSHAVFENIFLEHLCLDRKMNFIKAASSFIKIFRLRNASIVHLNYNKGQATCGWSIIKR